MRPRSSFVLATAVAFLLATLAWLVPLLPHLRTTYLGALHDPTQLSLSDAMLTSWMLAWASHALQTDPLGLFHANIFHPLPWTLAFSENLLASALLVMPVDLAFGDPVLDHNVLLIASFVLCGVGTAWLVRELGGGLPAAWLAGAIVAFDPFRFATIGHVHALSTHWMPFALLALHRCLRRGRGGVLVALTVLLVTLSSVYYAYFFLLALAVFVPAHWLLGCPAAPGGRARALAGIAAAAVATAIMLLPYMIARDLYALGRDTSEAWFLSARGITYLGGVLSPRDYLMHRYLLGEVTPTVIGPATFVLMLIGLGAGAAADRGGRRTTAAYLAMAVVLALVSMGPLLQWRGGIDPNLPGPWEILVRYVPGFMALRVPIRGCTVPVLAVAVIAAFGAQALWRRAHGPRARAAVLVLLLAIGALESWRPAFDIVRVAWAERAPSPVYRWLAAQPGNDAVVELPIGLPAMDAEYMVMSAAHWRPLVNGYSGFTPTMSFFRNFLFAFPSPSTLRLLHDIGVRWVVAHPSHLPPGKARICDADPAPLAPYLTLAYRDPTACAFEIQGAPPAAPVPPDRAIPLDGVTVSTAAGTDAAAAIDRRLDTHWTEAVDQNAESWLQLDLPAPHTISRLVVELGPHFGEFLRQWRIDTSLDGVTWETAGSERAAVPPLVQLRTEPDRLSTEMRLLTPTPAQHVRLVRLGADKTPSIDLWGNWRTWGVHELQAFETTP